VDILFLSHLSLYRLRPWYVHKRVISSIYLFTPNRFVQECKIELIKYNILRQKYGIDNENNEDSLSFIINYSIHHHQEAFEERDFVNLFYITNSILRMYFIYFNMFLYWITPLLCSFQIKHYYYIIYIMYKTNRQVILYLFQLQQEYMKICFTQEKSCFQRTSPEHFTATYAISANKNMLK
jgi:hypothetical protein